MPSRSLPNLGLRAFYDFGENGWAAEQDLNLLKLSVLTQGGVVSKVSTTPASPAAGDTHIFDATHPTNANQVAVYDAGQWKYFIPSEGWLLYNRAADYFEFFDGAVWSELATGGGGSGSSDGAYLFERFVSQDTTVSYAVDSTSFVAINGYWPFTTLVDYVAEGFTEFKLYGFGQSSTAGETVALRLTNVSGLEVNANALNGDVTFTNSIGVFDSGWQPLRQDLTGMQQLRLFAKGSNSTVDLILRNLYLILRKPPQQAISTGGLVFPTSPVDRQRFFRTDRDIEYFYDAANSRWLSTQLFTQDTVLFGSSNYTGTTSSVHRQANPWSGKYSIFFVDFVLSYILVGTGSWTVAVNKVSDLTTTEVASLTVSTQTSGSHYSARSAVNLVLDAATVDFDYSITENSGSASFYPMPTFTYRLVG